MKSLFTSLLYLLTLTIAYTQQDPVYSLYMNNPYVLNPAYSGYGNVLQTQLSYRTQWTGLEGNPKTINFNSHMSVYENKAGAGIQVIQDKIGEHKNTEVQASFAYKLSLSNSTLAFGMQAGVMNFSNNPDELTIRHADDPYFRTYSAFSFNTGAGFLLTSERYMVGLSVPRLLPSTVSEGGQEIDVYNRTLYLTGAYVFLLSEKLRFKPGVLLRTAKNNPISTDVQATFSMVDSFSAGVFTRSLNTYGILASCRFKSLQVGYVFEVPANRSKNAPFTSHEVFLAFSTSAFSFHDVMAIRNF